MYQADALGNISVEDDIGSDCDSPELMGEDYKLYQSLAARLNYYALDRLDIMFAVKELMRKLSI